MIIIQLYVIIQIQTLSSNYLTGLEFNLIKQGSRISARSMYKAIYRFNI